MFIHYLAILRYWIYYYYYYINIPLSANKSRCYYLLRTPLVVSGVLLLLLLSVEQRLQELQPLLYVWRHGGHGGLQELKSLLQLPVCWRGPGDIRTRYSNDVQCSDLVSGQWWVVSGHLSSHYFISLHWTRLACLPACLPACLSVEDVINVRPHYFTTSLPRWSTRPFCLEEMRRLTGHNYWLTGQWSVWNVSLSGIHCWSSLCWPQRYSGKNTNNQQSLKI